MKKPVEYFFVFIFICGFILITAGLNSSAGTSDLNMAILITGIVLFLLSIIAVIARESRKDRIKKTEEIARIKNLKNNSMHIHVDHSVCEVKGHTDIFDINNLGENARYRTAEPRLTKISRTMIQYRHQLTTGEIIVFHSESINRDIATVKLLLDLHPTSIIYVKPDKTEYYWDLEFLKQSAEQI